MSELKPFEELNAQENELWKFLDENTTEEVREKISELIEVNLELEKHCNQ